MEVIVDNDPKKHNANYYKLSVYGIYYLIANDKALSHTIMKAILKNYGDHPLFHFFLYPYIGRNSLLEIVEPGIFSAIFSYLHELCKKIQETSDRMDKPTIILTYGGRKSNPVPLKKESIFKIFRYDCQTRAFDLIHSIISVFTRRYSTVDILAKDERFLQAVEKTKEHFDNMYKLFGIKTRSM